MKRKKGMTLLEVVVAIAIFGLLSILLVQIISSVNAVMKATNHLSERLYTEKTYVNTLEKNSLLGINGIAENDTSTLVDLQGNTITLPKDSHGNDMQLGLTVIYGDSVNDDGTPKYSGATMDTNNSKPLTKPVLELQAYDENPNEDGVHYRFLQFNGEAIGSSSSAATSHVFYLRAPEELVKRLDKVILSVTGADQYLIDPVNGAKVQKRELNTFSINPDTGAFLEIEMDKLTTQISITLKYKDGSADNKVDATFAFWQTIEENGKFVYRVMGASPVYTFTGSGLQFHGYVDASTEWWK